MNSWMNCKICIVGDHNVGKTAMLISWTTGMPRDPYDYIPTVFDSYTKREVVDGQHIYIGLWDTVGKKEYDKYRHQSYPQTDVFLFCFDITNRESLDNISSKWIPDTMHYCPSTPFLIVGCKKELRNNQLFLNESAANKFMCGYLRDDQSISLPLDVFKIIAGYLQNGYYDKCVTDDEAEKLCAEVGGYQCLNCSSVELTGLNEIFEASARCFLQKARLRSTGKKRCNIL